MCIDQAIPIFVGLVLCGFALFMSLDKSGETKTITAHSYLVIKTNGERLRIKADKWEIEDNRIDFFIGGERSSTVAGVTSVIEEDR